MYITIVIIGITIYSLLFIWTVWSIYCNEKTLSQMITIYRRDGTLHDVTYDEHFRELLLFRDPMKLYNKKETDTNE